VFGSHIGHNVIRKEEKKAQNVEQEVVLEKDAYLPNELLETDVP